MKTITYEPMGGENIAHTVRHTARLSKTSGCRVRFRFNDVTLYATPKKSPVTIRWEWELINGQRAEQYRLSKKGQQERARRAAEIVSKQYAVTAAVRGLPGLVENNNLDHLMGWLHSFVEHADDIGVDMNAAANLKGGGHEWIAILFESKGYKENPHVGQPPEWFNTRERMGQYIIGQAINCLRRGMPPHPITQSFVAKYYALPPVS